MERCLRYGELMLGLQLKVWRGARAGPVADGLTQFDGYLAGQASRPVGRSS